MKFIVFNCNSLNCFLGSGIDLTDYKPLQGERCHYRRSHRIALKIEGQEITVDEFSVVPVHPLDGSITVLTRRHVSGILNSLSKQTAKVYAEEIAEALGVTYKTVMNWRKMPNNLLSSYTRKEVLSWEE